MSGYQEINRRAWAYYAREGSFSSQPFGAEQFSSPRPWLDPDGWIPWKQIHSVLCLACGGGQQAPLFASLGYKVTLVDLSPDQLQLDREVAERNGLEMEYVEGDMLDLSALYGRNFDLVYQAVSACYIPDVRRMYGEIHRVLKEGGYYWGRHWNPLHLQLPTENEWDGHAYRIVRQQIAGDLVPRLLDNGNGSGSHTTCWHYLHTLQDLVGGLCDSGFVVLRFGEAGDIDPSAEPGSYGHLAAFLPAFFTMLARRRISGPSNGT